MSLIDDASRAVHRHMDGRDIRDEASDMRLDAVLAALTADGPVILLPDEGECVKVATWAEVLRYSEEYRRLQVSDVLEIAGEVAE